MMSDVIIIAQSTDVIRHILSKYPSKCCWRNLDKWKIGTPLFITGVGGSGKSTLARELATTFDAEVISSDTVIFKMKWSKDRFEKKNTSRTDEIPVLFHPMALEYVNDYKKDLPTDTLKHTKDGRPSAVELEQEHDHARDFLRWVKEGEKKRPEWETKRVIVEGTYPIHAPEEIIGYPVIILRPSKIKAFVNRIKRKHKNGCSLFVVVKTVTVDYVKFEHWFDKQINKCATILMNLIKM